MKILGNNLFWTMIYSIDSLALIDDPIFFILDKIVMARYIWEEIPFGLISIDMIILLEGINDGDRMVLHNIFFNNLFYKGFWLILIL